MNLLEKKNEQGNYINVNGRASQALLILITTQLVITAMNGDEGEWSLSLLIVIFTSMIWFVYGENKSYSVLRRLVGALIFDVGLFLLYFFYDYMAPLILVIVQLMYIFIYAISGEYFFPKSKT